MSSDDACSEEMPGTLYVIHTARLAAWLTDVRMAEILPFVVSSSDTTRNIMEAPDGLKGLQGPVTSGSRNLCLRLPQFEAAAGGRSFPVAT